MGYYSTFAGRIEITPPLLWGDIRDSKWLEDRDLLIEVHEAREDTDYGEVLVREGIAVVPWQEESYKGYEALGVLQEIVAAFPDRTYTGHIRVEGEEAGDVRRLLVRDGKATEWRAELVWPDGTRG